MIRYIKRLFNTKNDHISEINDILNNNTDNKLHFELSNTNLIKINISNTTYDIDYIISEKEFLKILNNLIIKEQITLTLVFILVYHKEISCFIIKNKIENIHLYGFNFQNLDKLQLNLNNIKHLTLDLSYKSNDELLNILNYVNKMKYLEYLCCKYIIKQLKEIVNILKYNKTIKHLHLINNETDFCFRELYVFGEFVRIAYNILFLNNSTLINFTSEDSIINTGVFETLQYNKTLQNYSSVNETLIIFNDKTINNSINNLKIYNDTLNNIIIDKEKFSNDKSQIKLDFHYVNVNFIYLKNI